MDFTGLSPCTLTLQRGIYICLIVRVTESTNGASPETPAIDAYSTLMQPKDFDKSFERKIVYEILEGECLSEDIQ